MAVLTFLQVEKAVVLYLKLQRLCEKGWVVEHVDGCDVYGSHGALRFTGSEGPRCSGACDGQRLLAWWGPEPRVVGVEMHS